MAKGWVVQGRVGVDGEGVGRAGVGWKVKGRVVQRMVQPTLSLSLIVYI
jgi:hypothetical protein